MSVLPRAGGLHPHQSVRVMPLHPLKPRSRSPSRAHGAVQVLQRQQAAFLHRGKLGLPTKVLPTRAI